jgi:hypothetical protein
VTGVDPGPGERIFVLDIPFGVYPPNATWRPDLGAKVYIGKELPENLAPYRAESYSYWRWIEDDLNGTPGAALAGVIPKKPRDYQLTMTIDALQAIGAGSRAFFNGAEAGVGKTIPLILTARWLAEKAATAATPGTVLVVSDRPATVMIPHWSYTIASVGDGSPDVRWLVTTWDRLAKIKDLGVKWDVVIEDESQALRNTTTARYKAHRAVVKPGTKGGPVRLLASATPAHDPLEMAYMSDLFAYIHGEQYHSWFKAGDKDIYPQALIRHGLHVAKGRYGWAWTEVPAERRSDIEAIRSWLGKGKTGTPVATYQQSPQGPVPLDMLPVHLNDEQRALYESEWSDFRASMKLARRNNDKVAGRVALLRLRQKAGMIRIDPTVEWVSAQVDKGLQVAIACEFVETAAEPLANRLAEAGVKVARIYGTNADVENERLKFQTGEASVVVFTPVAGFSLHRGEKFPRPVNGHLNASDAIRVGLYFQVGYSGIRARQRAGRTHRDEQVSSWFIGYGVDTYEQDVAARMMTRIATATELAGGSSEPYDEIAGILGADWLPAAAILDD